MPPEDGRMLRAALRYAEHGWPVFPCKPGDKKPLTEHGFQEASTDPEQIREWWGARPDANVAVPTGAVSGIVVLDADGPGADAALQELGASVPTLTNITSKGRHLLFKHPGLHTKTCVRVREDLDVPAYG